MIADTSSIAGYTIFREEPSDTVPNLSTQHRVHPLGMNINSLVSALLRRLS